MKLLVFNFKCVSNILHSCCPVFTAAGFANMLVCRWFPTFTIVYFFLPLLVYFSIHNFLVSNCGLFFLFVPPRKVPLAFVAKLVWWYGILWAFACRQSFWFFHQIWMRALLGRMFLVVGSALFDTLNILHHLLLACKVSAEKSSENFMEIPLLFAVYLLLLFDIFSLSLIFVNLITLCLTCSSFSFSCLGLSALPRLG